MGRDLKLEVVLQAIDRVTRPIRAITQGSIGLGRALKDSRDQLKQLQAQQADISSWRTLRAASEQTDTALQAARDRVKALGRDMASTGAPTRQMTRDLKAAIREATALKKQHQEQQVQLQGLRTKLGAAGISTRNLSQQERDLRQRINQTNQTISEQTKRMQALSRQARQAAGAKAQFEKAQQVSGSMAAGGAAGLASGYGMAKPLQGIVEAFAPAEDAATQLKVSMMDKNGEVSADFKRITDLATGLGDRLPGTTADFQEMMTMLRRQGISAQSILGGTGEAAAYLGVQLKMPAAEAAAFAAQMQDATRTSEKDMMALMDTIQRGFYSGVDPTNMINGFAKISPVMDIIKQSGLEAANTLAPLLVMMDQTKMEGGSAGNAYRKIFQSVMDTDTVKDMNKTLALKKRNIKLEFTDGKGEFGGIKNLYAQLAKLKDIDTESRLPLLKDLFGDDAETLQTLNTMINKGIAGYDEVAAKMKDQADLRTRVNEQLTTLTNTIEAAQGSWTNAMSEIGATIAPELKDLINDLGNVAVSVKEWVKANPGLTAAIFKTAAGLALLLAVGGAIGIMLASMLGPFAIVRYALTLIGIKSLGAAAAFKGVGAALLWVGKAILLVGRALLMNPIGLVVTAIAAAAYLIYTNWEPVKAFFLGLWAEIKAGFNGGLTGILGLIANFSPIGMFYRAFAAVMNYFGVELPGKFTDFGSMLMQGMVQGITNGLTAVKGAITGAADSTVGWFKEKLGIHSPSRVFAELGGFTMAGLEQGLANNQGGPLAAVVDMGKKLATAGAVAFGMSGPALAMDNQRSQLGAVVDMSKTLAGVASPGMTGPAIAMDNRAPLAPTSGRAGGVVVQGDTYQITIHAAPGTDAAGMRQMLNQLLDERERSKSARVRSALQDKD